AAPSGDSTATRQRTPRSNQREILLFGSMFCNAGQPWPNRRTIPEGRTNDEGLLMKLTKSWPHGGVIARLVSVALVALVVGGGTLVPTAGTVRAQQDNRYFQDTGFRVDNDKIWDYFSKRGGRRTFGLPTSRTFQFLGAPTQFFQRHVLQVT